MTDEMRVYLAAYPEEIQRLFNRLAALVPPEHEAKLWAKLPSFYRGEAFVRLIPFKDHINVEAWALDCVREVLADYRFTPKGMLQLRPGQRIPEDTLSCVFALSLAEPGEAVLRRYFAAWLNQDDSQLEQCLAPDIFYRECYGPEYRGLDQVRQWFADWNQKGTVLEWSIRQCLACGDQRVVEWYFRCRYQGTEDGFDGVTIARLNAEGKICELKEFQSKAEHFMPYGDVK